MEYFIDNDGVKVIKTALLPAYEQFPASCIETREEVQILGENMIESCTLDGALYVSPELYEKIESIFTNK